MQSDFSSNLKKLEKCFNVEIKDESNFLRALTHTSYTGENNIDAKESYERLEFLGDAVLKLFMSDVLYKKYPDFHEGSLTKIRSILVSDNMLAKLGRQIGLDKIVILGHQEEKLGGRKKSSITACAFEAVLGAYYLDGSLNKISKVLEDLFKEEIEAVNLNVDKINTKATLQEYTQGKNKELPIYRVVEEKGPEHDKIFVVEVSYMGKVLAQGKGKTKKDSEQDSAAKACRKLGIINE